MRSVCKTWPARLVSTVAALVLILASAVGVFSHAAGHAHNSPLHMWHTESVETASVDTESGPDHLGDREKGEKGQPHSTCCDTICHGGQAVLASALALPLPVAGASFSRPSASLHSEPPGYLERPPRSPVLA
jgi:hypothetical protein